MTVRPVALVSGGSRGIGRAVVTRLARDGYDVAFCYAARAEAAKETEERAAEHGARVLARRADVGDAGQPGAKVRIGHDAHALILPKG